MGRRPRPRRRSQPPAVGRSGVARLRAPSELLLLPRRSPLHATLVRSSAAADRFHLLHSDLERVPVRATATTTQSGCYRLRHGDPIDLRVSRLHGRVPLSFLHELGHLIDHQVGREIGREWASATHYAFARWRETAATLPSRAPAGAGRGRRRYFDSTKELWARSYAQTVLARSGDAALERHLRRLQAEDEPFVWPALQFAPLAVEVDRVFDELGLLRERRLFAA